MVGTRHVNGSEAWLGVATTVMHGNLQDINDIASWHACYSTGWHKQAQHGVAPCLGCGHCLGGGWVGMSADCQVVVADHVVQSQVLHSNRLLLLLQSAEELDKERLEAREKVDAQGKQQRQENARRNAEAVAQQKVSHAC